MFVICFLLCVVGKMFMVDLFYEKLSNEVLNIFGISCDGIKVVIIDEYFDFVFLLVKEKDEGVVVVI